jgi:hypothetical protein
VKRAAIRRPTFFHRLDHCRLPRGCEQAFEPSRLGTKILIGHANVGAKFRGGVPWPARIEEDRARQRDQVGIAGRDDRLGLIEAADQPDGNHRDTHDGLDRTGKRHLIARTHRDLLRGI